MNKHSVFPYDLPPASSTTGGAETASRPVNRKTGIVASIVTPSATEQAIDTVLVSLYVGDEKEMIVSVDELDITSVAVGQNVELAMDAIPIIPMRAR